MFKNSTIMKKLDFYGISLQNIAINIHLQRYILSGVVKETATSLIIITEN